MGESMDNETIRQLIDELFYRDAHLLRLDAGANVETQFVEGFLEHSKQVLIDYYSNNELPL